MTEPRNHRDPDVVRTVPPTPGDEFLVAAFREETVRQVQRLDDTAREMLKLELGVPGLYAAALTLAAGKDAVLCPSCLFVVFLCWLVAAVLTFLALFPRRYNVLEDCPRRLTPRKNKKDPLTIEEFYRKSAKCKHRLLSVGGALFFLGTILAVVSLFLGKPEPPTRQAPSDAAYVHASEASREYLIEEDRETFWKRFPCNPSQTF